MLPLIVRNYSGAEIAIADDEYSNLFVIVPATGAITRIRF